MAPNDTSPTADPYARRQHELAELAGAGDSWAKNRVSENARERNLRKRAHDGDEDALLWQAKQNQRKRNARAAEKGKRDSGDPEAIARWQGRLKREREQKRERRARSHALASALGQTWTTDSMESSGELEIAQHDPDSDDSENDEPLELLQSPTSTDQNLPDAEEAKNHKFKHEDTDDDAKTIPVASRQTEAAGVSMPAISPTIKTENTQAAMEVIDLTDDDVKTSIAAPPKASSGRREGAERSAREQELQLKLRKIQLERDQKRLQMEDNRLKAKGVEVEIELMKLRRKA